MMWHKQGLVYAPTGQHGWDRQYAHLPTADHLDQDTLRIYFAALDTDLYGRIGYVDIASADPQRILDIGRDPVLDMGEPGTFDDSGVNPSCLVEKDGTKYLYYIGWQRTTRVPYLLFAGVAATTDGRNFRKLSRKPVLDRTHEEPFIRSASTIIVDNGLFRCWYVSALRWTIVNSSHYPEYIIRYAESRDGLKWHTYDHVCVGVYGDEFGIGRPWVLHRAGRYSMWYSIRSRSQPYRIGYAESHDGICWERKDDLCGIDRSPTGWDSEMICYPCVVNAGTKDYMFYNGNRHGATGFGYALHYHGDGNHTL